MMVNPYKQTSITTASPGRLLVMLYDGLLKFMNQAVLALESGHREAAHTALLRAQDIITELRSSLEHDQAPELCQTLDGLYAYFYNKLVEANRVKSAAPIQEILPRIQELRDTWDEANRLAALERQE